MRVKLTFYGRKFRIFSAKDACLKYEMAQDNRSFKVNTVEEAYCLDEDIQVTEHTTRKSCEDASTSNEWVPKVCSMVRYKKEL